MIKVLIEVSLHVICIVSLRTSRDIKSSLEFVTISFVVVLNIFFTEFAFTIKSFNFSSLLKALEFSRICPTYGINDNSILNQRHFQEQVVILHYSENHYKENPLQKKCL